MQQLTVFLLIWRAENPVSLAMSMHGQRNAIHLQFTNFPIMLKGKSRYSKMLVSKNAQGKSSGNTLCRS